MNKGKYFDMQDAILCQFKFRADLGMRLCSTPFTAYTPHTDDDQKEFQLAHVSTLDVDHANDQNYYIIPLTSRKVDFQEECEFKEMSIPEDSDGSKGEWIKVFIVHSMFSCER